MSLFRIWEERNLSVEERRVLWLRRVRTPEGLLVDEVRLKGGVGGGLVGKGVSYREREDSRG